MKVLGFGEILLRLSAPGYTKLFQKDYLDATFCGAEANVAVSLAVLGIESAFLTKLPDNVLGKAAENSLRYFGVDTGKIQYGEGRMGTYFLEKGASQRSSKIIYDRAYSAFALMKRDELAWERIFEGIGWFHWSGINPALSENIINICLDALKTAKNKNIVVSCDLNYRKNLWSEEKAQRIMCKLLPYVDICIANEEDADKTLGIKNTLNDMEAGRLDRVGYREVAKKIYKRYGCKYVATTLRESYSASNNGWSALLYDCLNDELFQSKKYDIQLVDRVGGGDSFAAGLIYGFLSKMNHQEIIEFATAASCLQQTIEGDYNRNTVCDIQNLLVKGGSGRVER